MTINMPIKVTPYQHQKNAFQFTCGNFGLTAPYRIISRGTALLIEMGLGKTLIAIAVAGALEQAGKIRRVLIVAPLSILGVWQEEFERFAGYQPSWRCCRSEPPRRLIPCGICRAPHCRWRW